MKIKSADFVISNTDVSRCPNEALPEYAFIGRSNVGKSSLINMLYFKEREQLVCSFVLVDSRHSPQKMDMEFMQWLGENGIPFCIIFTKTDKLKPKAIEKQVADYISALLTDVWEEAPMYFVTSSSKRIGREEVLNFIESVNVEFFKKKNA